MKKFIIWTLAISFICLGISLVIFYFNNGNSLRLENINITKDVSYTSIN